jgi:hypothetical protein
MKYMRLDIFKLSVINDKPCRAKINIRHTNGGKVFAANVVYRTVLRTHGQPLGVCVFVCLYDCGHIVGDTVTHRTEIFV